MGKYCPVANLTGPSYYYTKHTTVSWRTSLLSSCPRDTQLVTVVLQRTIHYLIPAATKHLSWRFSFIQGSPDVYCLPEGQVSLGFLVPTRQVHVCIPEVYCFVQTRRSILLAQQAAGKCVEFLAYLEASGFHRRQHGGVIHAVHGRSKDSCSLSYLHAPVTHIGMFHYRTSINPLIGSHEDSESFPTQVYTYLYSLYSYVRE
ncbi:hypothetical protein GGR50DRAFT_128346 [Xylaria sp. CBS 124048]|nr:hypothetical protein GGR50DRAFT_128346 [Xylaria sp. CBS 124048]